MTPTDDQRNRHRYDVSGLQGKVQLTSEGQVLNLSPGGMALEAESWLQVGRSYTVTLRHESETVQLRGRVVWSKLGRTRKTEKGEVLPVYTSGLEFDQPLDETAKRLDALLEAQAMVTTASTDR